jgi:pimeloyl-ACP methyl ester carboxylesterase
VLAGALNAMPDRGMWLSRQVLDATLPASTREDFGAGGYAMATQDDALRLLVELDLIAAVPRIRVPTWFMNGQFDQLRTHETLYRYSRPMRSSSSCRARRTRHRDAAPGVQCGAAAGTGDAGDGALTA